MTLDDLKPFIDWMQAHPHWAGFATFLISIAESLAVIGLLIPGTIVMGAIGSLVGSGVLPSLNIVLWASAGAIVGDGISYWLGYHYHGHIREMWPFRSMPRLMQKGETFFLKHGGKSVFLGRFIGPIRPIIPVIAGMMNMPPWRFTLANVTSAITWAPAYMLPGYLIGAMSVQLAPHTATRLLVMVIIFLLCLWALYWIAKHLLLLGLREINQGIHLLWDTMRASKVCHAFCLQLQNPERPNSHLPLTLLLLSILTLSAFSMISVMVTHADYNIGLDNDIWNLARNLRLPQLDYIATGISFLGEFPILYTCIGVTLAWLVLHREWRSARHWALLSIVVIGSTTLLQTSLKVLPPNGLQLNLLGWSYPSIHTALSTAVYGFIAVILARQTRRRGSGYLWIMALLICLISLARVYLGIAWLSDVVGGLLLGIGSVLLFTLSYLHKNSSYRPSGSLATVAALAIVIPWGWYSYHYQHSTVASYAPHQPQQSLDTQHWWQRTEQPSQLYRHNLIGKPIELLNVQWTGSLAEIQHTLLQQGWHLVAKPNLAVILNRIAAKNREEQLPVFPQLYHHNRPALIMTRWIPAQKKMLVLRLWKSSITFADTDKRLWLGTIAYHKPWKIHFSHKQITADSHDGYDYKAAIQQLIHDVPDFTVKQIPTPKTLCVDINKGCSPIILLIQSS